MKCASSIFHEIGPSTIDIWRRSRLFNDSYQLLSHLNICRCHADWDNNRFAWCSECNFRGRISPVLKRGNLHDEQAYDTLMRLTIANNDLCQNTTRVVIISSVGKSGVEDAYVMPATAVNNRTGVLCDLNYFLLNDIPSINCATAPSTSSQRRVLINIIMSANP